MTNIVWIGNAFFMEKLRRPGLNLIRLDCAAGSHITWEQIAAAAGSRPDLVLAADKSLPPFVLGVEKFPCLTALYVVDSHIHSWFPHYAQAFDLCLVSLKDHLPRFRKKRLAEEQTIWFPPYCGGEPVNPDAAARHDKKWDLLFVGKLDPGINPERVEWMKKFRALEPRLHATSGNYHELYPQARLILNHSIGGDLNFRVFEALGGGVPLLSPRLRHGMDELFTDNADLFLFDQEDIPGAAGRAAEVLRDPEKMLEVAWRGYRNVTSKHLDTHRAASLLKLLKDWTAGGKAAEVVSARLKNADKIRAEHLRLIYLLLADSMREFPRMQEAYLAAASKND